MKTVLKRYKAVKNQLKDLAIEESELKSKIVDSLKDSDWKKHTESSVLIRLFNEYSILKTVKKAKKVIDYEKFYEMYYDPQKHPVVPKKTKKAVTQYKID